MRAMAVVITSRVKFPRSQLIDASIAAPGLIEILGADQFLGYSWLP